MSKRMGRIGGGGLKEDGTLEMILVILGFLLLFWVLGPS